MSVKNDFGMNRFIKTQNHEVLFCTGCLSEIGN